MFAETPDIRVIFMVAETKSTKWFFDLKKLIILFNINHFHLITFYNLKQSILYILS